MHINGEQEGNTGPLVPVGEGGYKERVQEAEYGGNTMYTCVKMKK
jgi:hypothetical protein